MQPDRRSENHHYVPQFYLRHWCDADGKMWVYPVEDGKPGFRAGPKNFAVEKALYDTSDVPHLATLDLEGQFSQLEGLFNSRWPDVFDGTMQPDTKMNISRFLALMYLRHPKHREEVRKTNALFRKMAAHAKSKGHDRFEIIDVDGKSTVMLTRDVDEFAADTPHAEKAGFLNAMHRSIEDLAIVLSARKWGVIFNTVDLPVYLTSDTPLILSRGTCTKPTFGFGTPGTEIMFPITPTKLLRMSDIYEQDGLHYPLVSLGDVNEQIVLTAVRFVFSPQELKDPDLADAASPIVTGV